MTFNSFLNFMTRGNKALVLTIITFVLMGAGSVMFFIGPDNSQETGEVILSDDVFNLRDDDIPFPPPSSPPTHIKHTRAPTLAPITNPPIPTPPPAVIPPPPPGVTPQPTTPKPTQQPLIVTPAPVITPAPVGPVITPAPTAPVAPPPISPVAPQSTPSTNAPVTASPIALDMRQYPFAVVYECDWKGNRLSLTTKTLSASVVRLCIEAPPLPSSEEPIEISYLSWFVFERQPYEGETLDYLKQHAVILAKPDPFGLTVMDCKEGAPVCKFATDLRDSFFEANAFLQGRGELVLQYTRTKTEAGYSPISIYFLLSSLDIKEPLQLGRRTEPVPQVRLPVPGATSAPTSDRKRRRGWPQRKAPLFVDPDAPNKQPP